MDKAKLETELETWKGYNKYIYNSAKESLRKMGKPVPSHSPPSEEVKKWTEKELWDLNKAEQVDLLKKLGCDEVPRYEKDRVKKLRELLD